MLKWSKKNKSNIRVKWQLRFMYYNQDIKENKQMLDKKYNKALTVILIIVVIAIFVILGFGDMMYIVNIISIMELMKHFRNLIIE